MQNAYKYNYLFVPKIQPKRGKFKYFIVKIEIEKGHKEFVCLNFKGHKCLFVCQIQASKKSSDSSAGFFLASSSLNFS